MKIFTTKLDLYIALLLEINYIKTICYLGPKTKLFDLSKKNIYINILLMKSLKVKL